jgi:hypothetical protein
MNAMDEAPSLPAKVAGMSAGGTVRALVPQTFDDVWRLANVISKSGMAPKDLKSPEAVSIAIMHGLEVGLPPMMALQSIAVINGRPTLWGDGALGLVRATGELEEFEEGVDGGGDKMTGYCRIKRKGQKTITHEFTVEDAKKAGLWNKEGPWRTYPRRMIVMRPRSWCLRDAFADVLKGLRIAEEVMDTDMRDITPPPPPSPPPAPPRAPTVVEQAQAIEQDPPPPDEPEPEIIETEAPAETASTMTYDDRIVDWQERLKAADKNVQEEIFETEIEPFREKGEIFPPDYNKLVALIKE